MAFAKKHTLFGAIDAFPTRRFALGGLAFTLTALFLLSAAHAQTCIEPTPAERERYPNRIGCNDSPPLPSQPPASNPSGPIYNSPVIPPTALQKALPRYRSLVRSLTEYKLVDTDQWLNLPLGSETEFIGRANDLHRRLLTQIAEDRYSKASNLVELGDWNEIIRSYPGRIAGLHTDIATARSEQKRLRTELDAQIVQRDLTQRTADQLEARAWRYESATERNKKAILTSISVLLPPRAVQMVSPRPYESIWEPVVGPLPERERTRPPVLAHVIVPQPPLRSSIPRSPVAIPRLSSSVELAVGQLETDAATFRASSAARWAVVDNIKAAKLSGARLLQDRDAAETELGTLRQAVHSLNERIDDAKWALLLAQDKLKSAQATFLYRAADAWIWENANAILVGQVKDAVQAAVRKSRPIAYNNVTEEEMEVDHEAGKQNIFGLPDSVLAHGGAIARILDRYDTLRKRSEDYMIEVPRLLAQASPQEIEAFVRKMGDGIDEDCQQLANANLDAIDVPEPFKSIAIKYLLNDPKIVP